MQTFVTSTAHKPVMAAMETAWSLDSKRLGKQRVECKQIWTALIEGKGWIHHPATKMWKGHEDTLALYGFLMCLEFSNRGYEDNLRSWFYERAQPGTDWPWWFGRAEMVATHRSKLIRKMPAKYKKQFAGDSLAFSKKLPYLWPNPDVDGEFFLSKSELTSGDWTVPENWRVTENGTVEFDFALVRRLRAQDDGVFYE